MGYLSGNTINLKAKLTPIGRQRLVTGNNTLISSFSLGDSDALYTCYSGLTFNQVPGFGGDNGGLSVNNSPSNYSLKSTLYVDSSTSKKQVEAASMSITSKFTNLGYKTIAYSGGGITQNLVSLDDISSDTLVNLFYSFSLPYNSNGLNTFTGLTSGNGGYSNTAYSGLAQTKILVIGIDNNEYAEMIDGKSINLTLETTAATYTIYGTYENVGRSTNLLDNDIFETSTRNTVFGLNRALLFSDGVLTPNGGDLTKSWATGYATNKPFSINGKETYNYQTNSAINLSADTPVGIAYLDRGFIVITEPSIVNDFEIGSSGSTATTITFDHVKTEVSQSITCIAERGQFGMSSNPTWTDGDTPRVTEIGLYDANGALIAIGKLNSTYYKPYDDMVAFNVTINY